MNKLPTLARPAARLLGGALAAALLLAGCAGVEWENKKPAEQLARETRAPGSVYSGWRVFQERCAGCHGSDAAGTSGAPDLLARVRSLGPQQFVGLVLARYDWTAPPGQSLPRTAPAPVSPAAVDAAVQRKDYVLTMPAWQGEPSVNAHVIDLYAYLAARSQGTQGPGRPER